MITRFACRTRFGEDISKYLKRLLMNKMNLARCLDCILLTGGGISDFSLRFRRVAGSNMVVLSGGFGELKFENAL
jgi:hypothetical protein